MIAVDSYIVRSNGASRVSIYVARDRVVHTTNSHVGYSFSPEEAEQLLYQLHGHIQTLRGIQKALPWSDRLWKALRVMRGR